MFLIRLGIHSRIRYGCCSIGWGSAIDKKRKAGQLRELSSYLHANIPAAATTKTVATVLQHGDSLKEKKDVKVSSRAHPWYSEQYYYLL